mgnify:CR=1 FL=1
MEEIGEKYLPIGTVVMLKGGTKRVMISGFCAIDGENVKNMYDYSGCVYPEGFLTSTQTCLFNHEQIEKVYHMGLLDDEEETNFNNKLKELVEKALTRSEHTIVPTLKTTIDNTDYTIIGILNTYPEIPENILE